MGVECTPGFDGGQSPLFILDVINEDSGTRVANSSAWTPTFFIDNLLPGTTLTMNLYAENGRGRSSMLIVEGSTLSAAEKHTGEGISVTTIEFKYYLLVLILKCYYQYTFVCKETLISVVRSMYSSSSDFQSCQVVFRVFMLNGNAALSQQLSYFCFLQPPSLRSN